MLIVATVVFPKIHSCLIVSFELRFLNIYTSVCLMNNEANLALSNHLFCDISLSLYL